VNATKQGWPGEKCNNLENKKEKGEDAGCHIAGERPEWTSRCLGEAG